MTAKLLRAASVLAAGGVMLQTQGCTETAVETVWRVGFSTVFLPLNELILTAFTFVLR